MNLVLDKRHRQAINIRRFSDIHHTRIHSHIIPFCRHTYPYMPTQPSFYTLQMTHVRECANTVSAQLHDYMNIRVHRYINLARKRVGIRKFLHIFQEKLKQNYKHLRLLNIFKVFFRLCVKNINLWNQSY